MMKRFLFTTIIFSFIALGILYQYISAETKNIVIDNSMTKKSIVLLQEELLAEGIHLSLSKAKYNAEGYLKSIEGVINGLCYSASFRTDNLDHVLIKRSLLGIDLTVVDLNS